MSGVDAAEEYRRAGARLKAHLESCGLCQDGPGCPEGDSAAEKEFRTFRAWERADEVATARPGRIGWAG